MLLQFGFPHFAGKFFIKPQYLNNKKVLLRERKRHTARRVASARYAALSHGGRGGGYPIQPWVWGYPIQSWLREGYPDVTPPHPDMGWGTPHPDLGWGTKPPIQTWDWVPPSAGWGTPAWTWDGEPPHPDLGWGTPPSPHNPDLGFGIGYPAISWMGYPPGPGMGNPPSAGWDTPLPRPGMGYPPPPPRSRCRKQYLPLSFGYYSVITSKL